MATVLRSKARGIWPQYAAAQSGVVGYQVVNDYGAFIHPAGCPAPSSSPWGEIQRQHKLVRGLPIWWVTTAGHGGYMVERTWAQANLSPQAVTEGRDYQCGKYQHNARNYLCYEEDADWAILEWEVSLLRDAFRRQRPTMRPAQDYLVSIFTTLVAWNYHYLVAGNYATATPLPAVLLPGEQSIGLDTRLWGLLYHLNSAAYRASRYQPVVEFARFERGDYNIVASELPGSDQQDSASFRLSLYRGQKLTGYRDVYRDRLGDVVGEEMKFNASPQLLLAEAAAKVTRGAKS